MRTAADDAMSLDELRRYGLAHCEDIQACQAYVDRSKAAGRMMSIDPSDSQWEEKLVDRLEEARSEPDLNSP